jgi:hypothetical protein
MANELDAQRQWALRKHGWSGEIGLYVTEHRVLSKDKRGTWGIARVIEIRSGAEVSLGGFKSEVQHIGY